MAGTHRQQLGGCRGVVCPTTQQGRKHCHLLLLHRPASPHKQSHTAECGTGMRCVPQPLRCSHLLVCAPRAALQTANKASCTDAYRVPRVLRCRRLLSLHALGSGGGGHQGEQAVLINELDVLVLRKQAAAARRRGWSGQVARAGGGGHGHQGGQTAFVRGRHAAIWPGANNRTKHWSALGGAC